MNTPIQFYQTMIYIAQLLAEGRPTSSKSAGRRSKLKSHMSFREDVVTPICSGRNILIPISEEDKVAETDIPISRLRGKYTRRPRPIANMNVQNKPVVESLSRTHIAIAFIFINDNYSF